MVTVASSLQEGEGNIAWEAGTFSSARTQQGLSPTGSWAPENNGSAISRREVL